MNDDRAAHGDFHVIRMNGLFHVVFRPDSDPEWFRIIATFYTYDRAYMYCDIERVSSYESWDDRGGNSDTAEEEHGGLRAPPLQIEAPEGWMGRYDGAPDLVRSVCTEAANAVEPLPEEDFSDHPNEDEEPKAYHDRQYEQAIAKEADRPVCKQCGAPRTPGSAALCRNCYLGSKADDPDPRLTDKQEAVFNFLRANANPLKLVSVTFRLAAEGAGVARGSIVYLVETLERKGFIEIVERGKDGASNVFRVLDKEAATT